MTTTKRAKDAASRAAPGDWRSRLARFGLAARGVLYVVLGVLAIRVATGDSSSGQADQTGAIETVARQPFGQWLLAVLTAGLFALAAWRLLQALTGDPIDGDAPSERASFAVRGVACLGTGATALGILLANRGQRSGGEREAATFLLDLPGGRVIVAAVGLALIGVGGAIVVKHVLHQEFLDRFDQGGMNGGQIRAVTLAGTAGYAALGTVAAIVGVFFVTAGLQHDPKEAKGLSGVLAELAREGWGRALLWLVAVGLVLYGVYSFAEARYRRAT